MARWEPGARGRLEEAAFGLYAERGFEQTTVAELAARAGLTERTFFRHFSDKREVLFASGGALEETLLTAVERMPASLPAIDAVAEGLDAIAAEIPDRALAQQRQAIIRSNAELQERELIKLASLSRALAEALRRRGTPDPAATLTAEIAIAVFRIAFERWVDDAERRNLPDLIHDSLDELRAVTAEAPRATPAAGSALRAGPGTGSRG